MKVVVEKIREVKNKGNLRAMADVRIGRMLIRGCRVVQEEGKSPWVSLPVISWEENGETRYKTVLELPRDWKNAISDAVLKAWESVKQAKEPPQLFVVGFTREELSYLLQYVAKDIGWHRKRGNKEAEDRARAMYSKLKRAYEASKKEVSGDDSDT